MKKIFSVLIATLSVATALKTNTRNKMQQLVENLSQSSVDQSLTIDCKYTIGKWKFGSAAKYKDIIANNQPGWVDPDFP